MEKKSVKDDLISRKWLIEVIEEGWIKFDTQEDYNRFIHLVRDIAPSTEPVIIEALRKLWIDNILTSGEYIKISDRLSAIQRERNG